MPRLDRLSNSMDKESIPVAALAKSVWNDFRRGWSALVVYEALFKLLQAWLFVPAMAGILAAVMSQAGHVALSNLDILDFALTPSGLLYGAVFGTAAVALLLFEQAGIVVLASMTDSDRRLPIRQLLPAAVVMACRVIQLGGVKLALLALTFAPFFLLAVLAYSTLFSHDINYYLAHRPPVFWLAAGIGCLLLLAALAAGLFLFVRWALALPILLFENRFGGAALRASGERVRGAKWRIAFLLLGWQLGALLLGIVLQAVFRIVAAAVLRNAGELPLARIVLLLAAQGGLLAAVSFVTAVGHGLMTRRLYLLLSGPASVPGQVRGQVAPDKSTPRGTRYLAYVSLAIVLLVPLILAHDLTRHLPDRRPVEVTAHRGHSAAAPENTLSAIRKAIHSGADYAEVDVLQTRDGVVVLLHDRDLKRVAGDPRRIEDLTFDEVQELDVGSWFDLHFVGERVPTLVEAIQLSRGRIKLNIELKFFGPDRRLARTVAEILRQQDFESQCLVTSNNYNALLDVKRHNSSLRTGLIVAQALGDVNRLQVDAISVRASLLTDEMLRSAQRLNREVHVWGVSDARQMLRLIQRGVDNLIVSDPDVALRVRSEWARLTGPERLLLASRLLLGLDPGKTGGASGSGGLSLRQQSQYVPLDRGRDVIQGQAFLTRI